jgi:hypothetical protein
MGEAIPLRAQSLQAQAGKVVEQIGTPALLIPSCGGLSADCEEKRVTHGSDTAQPNRGQEQLDFRDPNQRGQEQLDFRNPNQRRLLAAAFFLCTIEGIGFALEPRGGQEAYRHRGGP